MSRIAKLQTRLEEKANPKTKAWWERYLWNVIQFLCVKMAQIRAALHAWIDEDHIDCLSSEGLRYATEKMEPEIQQHLRGSRQR